jgi:hypothetical protein
MGKRLRIGGKGKSFTRMRDEETDPTHMPVLERHGLYQHSIRHDVAVQACQLVTLLLSTLRGRRLTFSRLSHGRADYFAGYFLWDEDILGFMMTSMW